MIIRLYYANQLIRQWARLSHPTYSISREILEDLGREIYNGGYVCSTTVNNNGTEWFRCDTTPVLLGDVPKELLLLELLQT
jgi:hypothetical protein